MSGAVFLSYASQDASAARRICEALRAAGVEVWFDESDLRGGDAWDAKIRKQIRECALFVPIISASTQTRSEGYFRLEWKLAVDRSHLLAEDHPFLFPVVLGEVTDATGRVPEKFKEVQWTRLRLDETPQELAGRVARLLGGDPVAADRPRAAPPIGESRPRAGAKRGSAWVWVVAAVIAGLAGYGVLKLRRAPQGIDRPSAADAAAPLSGPRQLAANARALFDRLDSTREDFSLATDLLKQAMDADGVDAEVWAACAQLHERYLIRGFDVTAQRQELARTSVQRALRLDPQSFEGRLAQARLLVTVGGDGKDLREGERILRMLHQERPGDQRALRGLATAADQLGRVDEACALNDESARLPGGDPLALYDKSLDLLFVGRPAEAEAALRACLAQKPFSSAMLIGMWYAMMLHGDLDRAKSMLDEIPSEQLEEDRGCYFSYLLFLYRHEPDTALARLRAVPRDWLYDNWYRGPKDLLIGVALHMAGRPDAAAVEWQAALKLVEARLADNPSNVNLLSLRVQLLAYLGENDRAAREFSTLLQLGGGRPEAR
jgi:cytochrome c-type biogenesis protein CcmH/NrfG